MSSFGGIRGWQSAGAWSPDYPEITGYIIPTLAKWGRSDLAYLCAQYLVDVQLDSGAFPSMSGEPVLFDTAAAIEGLACAYFLFLENRHERAWWRAQSWVEGQSDIVFSFPLYNARASAIYKRTPPPVSWDNTERSHYLAYWLEGEHRCDASPERWRELTESLVVPDDGLLHFHYEPGWKPVGGRKDICATLQMANLFAMRGRRSDAERMVNAVIPHVHMFGGGVPLDPADPDYVTSWCAKFFLDAAWTLLHPSGFHGSRDGGAEEKC